MIPRLIPRFLIRMTWLITLLAMLNTHRVEAAHPFHISSSEIEFNADSKTFEVSICLWAEDVEQCLNQNRRSKVSLENLTVTAPILRKYMQQNFVIMDRSGRPLKFNWVGQELEEGRLWIYLEFRGETDPEGCFVENRVMFDLSEQQANLMSFRWGKRQRSATSTRTSPKHQIGGSSP